MNTPAENVIVPVKLHCLEGGSAPPEIVRDLRRLVELPPRAKQAFWEALGPCLSEAISPAVEEHLDRFCRAHGADGDTLAAAIKACRFLLRHACAIDLGRGAFAEDLAALSGGNDEIAAILLAGYELAKSRIRAEILQATLADHGKLLEGIDWKVDYLATSSRGDKLRAPVVTLTLRYREGERKERVTLQLLPETLKEIQSMCERILK